MYRKYASLLFYFMLINVSVAEDDLRPEISPAEQKAVYQFKERGGSIGWHAVNSGTKISTSMVWGWSCRIDKRFRDKRKQEVDELHPNGTIMLVDVLPLRSMPHLRYLYLYAAKIEREALEYVLKYTDLYHLEIAGYAMNDRELEMLREYQPAIQHLVIEIGRDVTQKGIDSLCDLQALYALSVHFSQGMKNKTMRFAGGSFRKVTMWGRWIEDREYPTDNNRLEFVNCLQMISFSLAWFQPREMGISLKSLPLLEFIEIDYYRSNQEGSLSICNVPRLQTFKLSTYIISKESLAFLTTIPYYMFNEIVVKAQVYDQEALSPLWNLKPHFPVPENVGPSLHYDEAASKIQRISPGKFYIEQLEIHGPSDMPPDLFSGLDQINVRVLCINDRLRYYPKKGRVWEEMKNDWVKLNPNRSPDSYPYLTLLPEELYKKWFIMKTDKK